MALRRLMKLWASMRPSALCSEPMRGGAPGLEPDICIGCFFVAIVELQVSCSWIREREDWHVQGAQGGLQTSSQWLWRFDVWYAHALSSTIFGSPLIHGVTSPCMTSALRYWESSCIVDPYKLQSTFASRPAEVQSRWCGIPRGAQIWPDMALPFRDTV